MSWGGRERKRGTREARMNIRRMCLLRFQLFSSLIFTAFLHIPVFFFMFGGGNDGCNDEGNSDDGDGGGGREDTLTGWRGRKESIVKGVSEWMDE